MKKILVPIGCRSDEGLSKPIIDRLKKEDWCEVQTVKLEPQNFITSYQIMEYHCKADRHIGRWDPVKPDLVLIVGDRVEMTAAACAAFHNNVPIAHMYAGIINDPITTYDDIDRHCITLWSDLQLVENEETKKNVIHLKFSIKPVICDVNKILNNIRVVGITHLDDIEIDESKVPWEKENDLDDFIINKEYDLILYNTPTILTSELEVGNDLAEIGNLIRPPEYPERFIILIGGNPDGEAEIKLINGVDEYYPELPREQFLGLLKNCTRFISNSSSCIYEAPYFLKPEQIIMIGDRNRNRPPVDCKPGGSDNVVRVLKEYLK